MPTRANVLKREIEKICKKIFSKAEFEFESNFDEFDGLDGEGLITFTLFIKPNVSRNPYSWTGSVELFEFPNCCGIGVLAGLGDNVSYLSRRVPDLVKIRKNCIPILIKHIERSLKSHYGKLMYSNVSDSEYIDFFINSGWTKHQSFVNPKTDNRLVVCSKILKRR